jgi:Mg-chelatase subunit ChlD
VNPVNVHRATITPNRWLLAVLPLSGLAIMMGGTAASAVPRVPAAPARPATTCDLVNPSYVAAATDWYGTDVVLFNDTVGNTLPARNIAPGANLGSLYGLAVDRRRGQVYAAATMDFRPFGLGGPGAVYRIDVATGQASLFTALDAGADPGPRSLVDPSIARWSGKMSLGDVDIDATMSELFVVNLYDRRIHRFSVPDGALLGAFDHGAAGEPWAENARVMGLGYRDGWLYHGVVDSRERLDLPGTLAGYVYRSRDDGADLTEVARFALDYRRERPWQAWNDATLNLSWPDSVYQPLVSDIDFRLDGAPILGLRNRAPLACFNGLGGDALPTRPEAPGRWSVVTDREWYQDSLYPPDFPEALFGGLAPFPGLDRIVATAFSPTGQWLEYGAVWFDNATGRIHGPADGRQPLIDNECQWMGDIELFCPPDASIPTPTPSATATPPASATPTTTNSPTATSTPTSTPTAPPTPTATPVPAPMFLPVLLNRPCVPHEQRADVALVLDLSTSMARPTRDGRTKLAAALDAAGQFVAQMRLEPDAQGRGDRVAVVGFNDTAWTAAGLTGDRVVIEAALAGLAGRMAEGTRLDLAFRQGQAVLAATHRTEASQPVLVLLTDGLPNLVPTPVGGGSQEDTVLAAALAVRAAGTRVFTIGLGQPDDVLADLLARAASSPADYAYAPDGADLANIYREIAGRLTGCP